MLPAEPHLKLVPSVEHRVRAVRGQIYFRPKAETFHEFLRFILRLTFGDEWWHDQQSLPEAKKHVVAKWSDSVTQWLNVVKTDENKVSDGLWVARASGYAQSLLQLAFDLFCLHQVDSLPEAMVNRLRDKNQFQGVRYEIAVSAIFARAGFTVEFCEEVEGEKICEFIARHPSGLAVAVEAKSRHRPGVLDFKGKPTDEFRADLKKIYAKARKKKPSMPFVIFLDANLPPTPETPWEESPWLQDLKDMFDEFPEPTPEQPDPHNMVIVTNYSFYFEGNGPSKMHPSLYFVSLYPKYPLSHSAALTAVQQSVERYTAIPDEL